MKDRTMVMPGYRVCEYTLVIDPNPDLKNKIAEIRKKFNDQYKISQGIGSKVNIALARFSQLEMMEARIVGNLNKIAMGYPPFKVELKDYGSFPSHTIFVNVISKLPVQGLIKLVRTETQRLMKLDNYNKPYFDMEPHITIGRKLQPWQYEKAWLEFSNKHFTARFIADAMLLLKRQKGEKPWQIVQRFEFQNLPISVKQGELFA
jgi:2'-5' RNA ligase